MGKEEDSGNVLGHEPQTHLTTSSDPAVLKRHIATLTQQLARQVQSYEELRVESTGMEKEMTRLRLRFAFSRELWSTANWQLETVIQNLLEHQLYGSSAPLSDRASLGAATATLDATYVASLHEQIQRLKEMVQRSGEERTQLRSEKQYEQTQLLLRSTGLSGATLEVEVREALEKMMLHWQEERLQYEATIEALEEHVSRHAEREALLGDEIKHEKELRQSAAVTTPQTSTELEELRAAQEELAEWRSGARSLSHLAASSLQPPVFQDATSIGHSRTSANNTSSAAEEQLSAIQAQGHGASTTFLTTVAPAERVNTALSTPMPRKVSADGTAITSEANSVDARVLQERLAELELLREDYVVREEALDSLYADNKHLQEALQGAEARLRLGEVELLECQRQLEAAQKELAREQQKTKRSEESCEKAAVVEAKLREQVRELRHALTAAAAAAEHDAAVPQPRNGSGVIPGFSIPQARGVRVGLPSRYEVAEQAITYEDGGTWREWAVEAGRWWSELNGDAMPAHKSSTGGGGVGQRGLQGPRRGPRVLLLFGGIMMVVMAVFLFLVIIEATFSALRQS